MGGEEEEILGGGERRGRRVGTDKDMGCGGEGKRRSAVWEWETKRNEVEEREKKVECGGEATGNEVDDRGYMECRGE